MLIRLSAICLSCNLSVIAYPPTIACCPIAPVQTCHAILLQRHIAPQQTCLVTITISIRAYCAACIIHQARDPQQLRTQISTAPANGCHVQVLKLPRRVRLAAIVARHPNELCRSGQPPGRKQHRPCLATTTPMSTKSEPGDLGIQVAPDQAVPSNNNSNVN